MNSPTSRSSGAAGQERSTSLIDQHSHFDGVYVTSMDLHIEGTVEGEIDCEGTVTIAEQARVSATVRASTVVLSGTAEGSIVCQEDFILQPTGTMRGQVRASAVRIEEGAFFEGEFRMHDAGESEEETESATPAAEPALDLSTAATSDDGEGNEADEEDAPALAAAGEETEGAEDSDEEDLSFSLHSESEGTGLAR